jgi:hypothetical protein
LTKPATEALANTATSKPIPWRNLKKQLQFHGQIAAIDIGGYSTW